MEARTVFQNDSSILAGQHARAARVSFTEKLRRDLSTREVATTEVRGKARSRRPGAYLPEHLLIQVQLREDYKGPAFFAEVLHSRHVPQFQPVPIVVRFQLVEVLGARVAVVRDGC